MLDIQCADYLAKVRAYADEQGSVIRAQLEEKLAYLEHYRNDECVCVLHHDLAPYSFAFTMLSPEREGKREVWFQGGLICHAPNSTGAGFPELSVTLSPQSTVHWQVHT